MTILSCYLTNNFNTQSIKRCPSRTPSS
uniref:Uncharacterized protein n=1 Tax=Rhizophora mucronata TaxID=61149 RepID=A0A2P2R1F4_RHIMU